MLFAVGVVLRAVCCWCLVLCCLLLVSCCVLCAVLLRDVCCLIVVVRCLLFVVVQGVLSCCSFYKVSVVCNGVSKIPRLMWT